MAESAHLRRAEDDQITRRLVGASETFSSDLLLCLRRRQRASGVLQIRVSASQALVATADLPRVLLV